MEKVCPWCDQPLDRGLLKNRTALPITQPKHQMKPKVLTLTGENHPVASPFFDPPPIS